MGDGAAAAGGADAAYRAALVRVRASAGALFVDRDGRVLLLHPTYQDAWEVPGGSVEVDESLDAEIDTRVAQSAICEPHSVLAATESPGDTQ